MLKRSLATLLVLAMLLCSLPIVAGAAETPAPRNFFANWAGDNMWVSWQNPKAVENTITGIKLYNTTSGTDVEIAGSWDTSFDAYNKVSLTGLTADAVYSFKLVMSYAEGGDVTAETSEKFCLGR